MFKKIKEFFRELFMPIDNNNHFMGVSHDKAPQQKTVITGGHERVGDYCNTCGQHILDCQYHRSSYK